MRIKVTQEDIDCGHRGDSQRCPIAQGIRRLRNPQHVEVCDWIEIDNDNYEAPAEVIEFIVAFDEGKPVEPFEFELSIVKRS
jgi:hypothetical protein